MPDEAITQYICEVTKPDDFDLFWEGILKTSSKLPLSETLDPLPLRSDETTEVFSIRYQSIDGVSISGWYSVPRKATGPLPALLYVPGYISDPPLQKSWARLGYAVLSIGPRGKLRSHEQFNPGYPGLLVHNIVDRNTYGYRGFYVDALRAVDFLRNRPEVDNSRIGLFGSSQGGGLTIATASLRNDIRAASAGAPYLCGYLDAVALTDSYPYEEINDYLRLYPERRGQVAQTLAYFDGINFAPNIACPIIVNIGLQDNVCPPETGYALFRDIGSKDKTLYPYDRCGHDAGRNDHNRIVEDFFNQHLTPGT
jgi:cephalosporin-C deacetylase